jgi:hypothetical protein
MAALPRAIVAAAQRVDVVVERVVVPLRPVELRLWLVKIFIDTLLVCP